MGKVQKYIRKYAFLIVVILSLPAVWALFVRGFFGASDDLHIGWLYEMNRTLSLGQLPPRFVPDLSYGFGYPLFNFVFPLPFYIGEIFHKLGLSLVDSIKAVFMLSVPLSMYFMYKFLKEYTDEILSLAGSVLYVYTPYRATDIYVRGAIGEIFAFIFPPLIALSIAKISKNDGKKWIGVMAIGVAGLIMSHNIMAYMFAPFLIGLVLFQYKHLSRVVYGFLLGLLVSVYFWFPAITESRFMKYGTGNFNFIDHFPTLRQLFTPYFGYGASVPGPGDGMSFFLGALNILLVAAAIIFIKKAKPIIFWALVTLAICVFLMNFRSTFLWNSIPYLPYFQFPWRFLSLTTFATSVLVIAFDKIKFGKIIGLFIIVLAIILNFADFKPHDFLGRLDSYYLNKYIPVPVASSEYTLTQEEYLRLPLGTKRRPDQLSPDTGLNASFNLVLDKDSVFNYYKYYFPGWIAKVDGKKVDITTGYPYGQITFDVPKGTHVVEVEFRETGLRKILNYVSLGSLILALGLLL